MEPHENRALLALATFNGAIFGVVGCLAAAVKPDPLLGIIAGCGAALCASIWVRQLTPIVSFEDDA